MSAHHIDFNSKRIEFEVERKNVKNVNVNIKPDRTIKVSAKSSVPLSFIQGLIRKKAPWILNQIKEFEEVEPERTSEREYVSGESYKYLGKQYRLRVQETEDKESVKYFRGFIYVYVKDASDVNKKKQLVDAWYKERADIIFNDLFSKVYPKMEKYNVDKPALQSRLMKTRWGSALVDKNTIHLNQDLIKAPKPCIEYVILHELIHFKYNDHSPKFYDMLYSMMPDWKKRKEILDKEVVKDL
ncbi:M48 family metallopeptidase [Alkalibacterium kapii]|uniref:Hydrolase n=1 Tax=Alkalibacterium kapii TaxID=426704 RepID=A0A511AXD0_9LACT|nr:SprT family zinc-dependent metalloprotease [Alkalibacterium kapii]GEK91781.1 hydrolase [Alkalibacterium kapii]